MTIIEVDISIKSRLDRYLKKLYPSLTQGIIEKALRLGEIKVNLCKATANLRIIEGDSIFIEDKLILSKQGKCLKTFSHSIIKLSEKIIKHYLIYEDKEFIAINKPAGLATQGGSKIKLSIDDVFCYLSQKNNNNFKLVHRLDKDTSGILLIAKNYSASIKLAQSFQEKTIRKTYFSVVLGRPPKDRGEISVLIGKNKEGIYQIVQTDLENGKLSITHYKLLKNLKNNLSLIEFTPITGRMHQLRLHAKLLGCPIVGDMKYGTLDSATQSHKMLLHAKTIILPKEIFSREILIDTELPSYFDEYIK